MSRQQRERCIPGATQTISLQVPSLPQHGEKLFQLDLGTVPVSLSVEVTFDVHYGGLGPAPDSLVDAGEAFLYLSDEWKSRPCDYRYFKSVTLKQSQRAVKNRRSIPAAPSTPPLAIAAPASTTRPAILPPPSSPSGLPLLREDPELMASQAQVSTAQSTTRSARSTPPPAASHTDDSQHLDRLGATAFQFKEIYGTIFFAVFAPVPLKDIKVYFRVYTLSENMVRSYDDDSSIWGLCRQYVVAPESYQSLLRWLHSKWSVLMVEIETLVDKGLPERGIEATGNTPLHVACEHIADYKLVKLLLERLGRFIPVDAVNLQHETALILLLSTDITRSDPKHPHYHKVKNLVELLALQCAAALDVQDVDGNTVLHYAMKGYRHGSEILPLLLQCGAGMFYYVRNNEGETPLECCKDTLLPPEMVAVERLLLQYQGTAFVKRTLRRNDQLPEPEGAVSSFSRGSGPTPPQAIAVDAFGIPLPAAEKEEFLLVPKPSRLSTCKGINASSHTHRGPLLQTEKLREEFTRLDTNCDGWLSRGELREVYLFYDALGVRETAVEIDSLIDSLGIMSDGRCTFDEYVLLILKLTRR